MRRPPRADAGEVERSRRLYFLLLALAGLAGWATGLWPLPLVAFAALELAWTLVERARDAPVRLPSR
jgi:hypothetical protein